jgi:hypothetical protein
MPQVTVGLPVSEDGVAGTLAMVSDLAADVQKAVLAFTVTAPLLKLRSLMATLMLLVVDVPVKPEGSVQV